MPTAVNPYPGRNFWLDPNRSSLRAYNAETNAYRRSMLARISANSTGAWIGDWFPDPSGEANRITTDAASKNQIPTIVTYAIPVRDLGSYSGGGLGSAGAYRTWIDRLAAGIASRPCVVIVEPDALAQASALDSSKRTERYSLIRYAVDTLGALAGCSVYVDAGNSSWRPASEMISALNSVGIAGARGFSTNVSNFNYTQQEINFGNAISAGVGGKSFVIDTSRNGLGPSTASGDAAYINPPGRALGERPIAPGSTALVDALLWVKIVGESDGNRDGAPPAGTFYPDYAIGLAERANWSEQPVARQDSSGTSGRAAAAQLSARADALVLRSRWAGTTSTRLDLSGVAALREPPPPSPLPTSQPRLRRSPTGLVVTGELDPPTVATGSLTLSATARLSAAAGVWQQTTLTRSATTTLILESYASQNSGPAPVADARAAAVTARLGLDARVAAAAARVARASAPVGLGARSLVRGVHPEVPDTWSLWTGREEVTLELLGYWFEGVLYPFVGSGAGETYLESGLAASAPVVVVGDDGLVSLRATITSTRALTLASAVISVRAQTGEAGDSTFGAYDAARVTDAALAPGAPLTLSAARYLGQGRYRAYVSYTLSREPSAAELTLPAVSDFEVVYAFDRPLTRTLHRAATATLTATGYATAATARDLSGSTSRAATATLTLVGGATQAPAPQPTSQRRLARRADGLIVRDEN